MKAIIAMDIWRTKCTQRFQSLMMTYPHEWIFGSFICNFFYLCICWSVCLCYHSVVHCYCSRSVLCYHIEDMKVEHSYVTLCHSSYLGGWIWICISFHLRDAHETWGGGGCVWGVVAPSFWLPTKSQTLHCHHLCVLAPHSSCCEDKDIHHHCKQDGRSKTHE